MAKRWILGLLGIGLLAAGWTRRPETLTAKRVIGQTVQVEISEAGLEFLGRVDTGAASTSVHAESVKVEGDIASFVLVNRKGGRVSMRAPIVKTAMVHNPEGGEKRIYVDLTICYQGLAKRVRANLNDRSGLTYAVLLGRNWLQDDFLVDVSREPVQRPEPVDRELLASKSSPDYASN
jgi:hypothetical protein